MKTTLNEIKKHSPCSEGWKKLLKHLGKSTADDEPLAFATILDSNGIEDAIWCLRVLPYREQCLFLADIAESVLFLYTGNSEAPRKAIEAIRDWHAGKISDEELERAARAAAYAAAGAAVYAAARAAAYAAAYAAYAAAVAIAYAAARTEKWAEIEALFIKYFC